MKAHRVLRFGYKLYSFFKNRPELCSSSLFNVFDYNVHSFCFRAMDCCNRWEMVIQLPEIRVTMLMLTAQLKRLLRAQSFESKTQLFFSFIYLFITYDLQFFLLMSFSPLFNFWFSFSLCFLYCAIDRDLVDYMYRSR